MLGFVGLPPWLSLCKPACWALVRCNCCRCLVCSAALAPAACCGAAGRCSPALGPLLPPLLARHRATGCLPLPLPAGELYDQIRLRGRLDEAAARFYAAEVVLLLEYLRQHRHALRCAAARCRLSQAGRWLDRLLGTLHRRSCGEPPLCRMRAAALAGVGHGLALLPALRRKNLPAASLPAAGWCIATSSPRTCCWMPLAT